MDNTLAWILFGIITLIGTEFFYYLFFRKSSKESIKKEWMAMKFVAIFCGVLVAGAFWVIYFMPILTGCILGAFLWFWLNYRWAIKYKKRKK